MDWEIAGDPTPLPSGTSSPGQSARGPVPRQQIVEFWKAKGAPPQVAEGIADAVRRESGIRGTADYDATAVNPQSGAVGLYQDLGPRKAALFAEDDWQNPATQNNFAFKEVTGGDPEATKHWAEIKAAPTREAASELWTKYFRAQPPGLVDRDCFGWELERVAGRARCRDPAGPRRALHVAGRIPGNDAADRGRVVAIGQAPAADGEPQFRR